MLLWHHNDVNKIALRFWSDVTKTLQRCYNNFIMVVLWLCNETLTTCSTGMETGKGGS